eukprot:scaffold1418_cov92-Skeletonema_dohrnii-CCMP3373.AAC.2
MTTNSKRNDSANKFITVATKTYDGGAKSSTIRPRQPRQQPVRKLEDPFMYYSDQETRMNELLMSKWPESLICARQ